MQPGPLIVVICGSTVPRSFTDLVFATAQFCQLWGRWAKRRYTLAWNSALESNSRRKKAVNRQKSVQDWRGIMVRRHCQKDLADSKGTQQRHTQSRMYLCSLYWRRSCLSSVSAGAVATRSFGLHTSNKPTPLLEGNQSVTEVAKFNSP